MSDLVDRELYRERSSEGTTFSVSNDLLTQIAGKLHNQNKKKATKSLVFVPDDAGKPLCTFSKLGHMLLIIRYTHVPKTPRKF